MSIRKVAILFGMGGQALDPQYGESYLYERLKRAEFTVEPPFPWTARQAVHDFLKQADFRCIIGDSMGASWGPIYAGDLGPTKVDYVAGFQPSVYAMPVTHVPANVVHAHCIRDPIWFDTFGLGHATWVADNPKATKLLITEHRGAHPDDWGYSQDLVFNELCKLAGKP